MKRRFVKLDKINPYDDQHIKTDDGFKVVSGEKDTNEHLQGIEYIKKQLKAGNKIMPVLLLEKEGRYEKLDGFKRLMAYKDLGYKNIEAFVCSQDDCDNKKSFKYEGKNMYCTMGGQNYHKFPKLLEGNEGLPADETILARGKDLRIELRENIHVHWGERGRYRIVLGQRDFKYLSEAIVWEK